MDYSDSRPRGMILFVSEPGFRALPAVSLGLPGRGSRPGIALAHWALSPTYVTS